MIRLRSCSSRPSFRPTCGPLSVRVAGGALLLSTLLISATALADSSLPAGATRVAAGVPPVAVRERVPGELVLFARDVDLLRAEADVSMLRVGRLGVCEVVRGQLAVGIGAPEATVMDFLERFPHLFGLEQPRRELVLSSAETDDLGIAHLRYRQRAGELPVWRSDLRAQVRADGVLTGLNGTVYPEIELGFEPAVLSSEARTIMGRSIGLPADAVTEPELLVARLGSRYALVWIGRARTQDPPGRWELGVDAHTADLVFSINQIPDMTREAFSPTSGRSGASGTAGTAVGTGTAAGTAAAVGTGAAAPHPLLALADPAARASADLRVVARSGDVIDGGLPIVAFGRGPSVNAAGAVAFVARQSLDDGGKVVVDDGTVVWSHAVAAGVSVGEVVDLGDTGSVLWWERAIATGISRIARAASPGADSDVVSSAASEFGLVHPWMAQNEVGQVAVSGDRRVGGTALALADETVGTLDVSTSLDDFVDFFPALAADATTVVRWGGSQTSPLRVFDRTLVEGAARDVVTTDEVAKIGARPAISADGRVAVVRVEINFRDAAILAVVLDREPAVHVELTRFATGEGDLDFRPGIVPVPGGAVGEYMLAYIASPGEGERALYVQRIDVADPLAALVSAPAIVVRTGDMLPGLLEPVVDIDNYDVLGAAGDVCVFVSTSSDEAIVVARVEPPSFADVGTGLGVMGDTKDHIDTFFTLGEYTLEDRNRRASSNPHGHAGTMQPGASISTFIAGSRPPGNIAADADNVWDAEGQGPAVDAHVYTGWTYDFLLHDVERNGQEDTGDSMVSTVDVGTCTNNAFWDGGQVGFCRAGNQFNSLAGDLDVVAHEWGHGVTEFTSNLVYERESGALNESFSDMTGVRLLFEHGDPSWVLARNFNGTGIRNMSNPRVFADPDCYEGRNWVPVANCTPGEQNDFCGVHSNSGVPNKMFQLLSEGGTVGRYTVEGMGIEDAYRLVYRANRLYWTMLSDFDDAMAGTIQAANDLDPSGGWAAQVESAWNAVCVGVAPNQLPLAAAGGPYQADVGEVVMFDGSGSSDADGEILSYTWDLGDGTIATGPTPWHAYDAAGTYTATLIVLDDAGAPATDETLVTIGPPSAVALADFALVPGAERVTLVWSTSFERHHLGFHVWRSEALDLGAADGLGEETDREPPVTRITRELLRNQDAGPATYEMVDRDVEALRTYRYELEAIDRAGGSQRFDLGPVAVGARVPASVRLLQSAPNPFNPRTSVRFELPASGPVRVTIFDQSGRRVRRLVEDRLPAGEHTVEWDGTTDSGAPLGSGVYLIRFSFGGEAHTQKVVLVR